MARASTVRQQVIPIVGMPATGAGAATLQVTGSLHAEVGDDVVMVLKADSLSGSTGNNFTSYFESKVTVRDQVQQTSTENLRALYPTMIFYIAPKKPVRF